MTLCGDLLCLTTAEHESNAESSTRRNAIQNVCTALLYVLFRNRPVYIFHLPSTCCLLTSGANAAVAIANPAIVSSKLTLLKPLSSTSNAMLGLTLVPNMSCP